MKKAFGFNIPDPRDFYNYDTKHKTGVVIRTLEGVREFISKDEFSKNVLEQMRLSNSLPENLAGNEKNSIATFLVSDFEKPETMIYLKEIQPYLGRKAKKFSILHLLRDWIAYAFKEKRKAQKLETISEIVHDGSKTDFEKLSKINEILKGEDNEKE